MATNQFGYISPYWSPNQFAPDEGMAQTDWGRSMLEKTPQTAFYRYFRGLGAPVEGDTGFGKWLQDQYGRILQGYQAATISDPLNMNINRYVSGLPDLSQWQRMYGQLAPAQRGLNPSAYGAGPARWVG